MTPIDFTGELAPLIWTMEGLMLVAVGWLVAMFFTEQCVPQRFHRPDVESARNRHPLTSETPADRDRRMAA
jgi:hypothetical protein